MTSSSFASPTWTRISFPWFWRRWCECAGIGWRWKHGAASVLPQTLRSRVFRHRPSEKTIPAWINESWWQKRRRRRSPDCFARNGNVGTMHYSYKVTEANVSSTRPFARPLARLIASRTHFLASYCSPRSRASPSSLVRSLVRSWGRGMKRFAWIDWIDQNIFCIKRF